MFLLKYLVCGDFLNSSWVLMLSGHRFKWHLIRITSRFPMEVEMGLLMEDMFMGTGSVLRTHFCFWHWVSKCLEDYFVCLVMHSVIAESLLKSILVVAVCWLLTRHFFESDPQNKEFLQEKFHLEIQKFRENRCL